jgi:hypothetical protein
MAVTIQWEDVLKIPAYCTQVRDLGLPTRLHHGLPNHKITFVAEAAILTARAMRGIPNLGSKSVKQIEFIFGCIGVKIGTTILNAPSDKSVFLAHLEAANLTLQPEIERMIHSLKKGELIPKEAPANPIAEVARELLRQTTIKPKYIQAIETNTDLRAAVTRMLAAQKICQRHMPDSEIRKLMDNEPITRTALRLFVS